MRFRPRISARRLLWPALIIVAIGMASCAGYQRAFSTFAELPLELTVDQGVVTEVVSRKHLQQAASMRSDRIGGSLTATSH